MKIVRYRIIVIGSVQGVGFRYHVVKLAEKHHVRGFVSNVDRDVWIEVEGEEGALNDFIRSVRSDQPATAAVRHVSVQLMPLQGGRGFRIRESAEGGKRH